MIYKASQYKRELRRPQLDCFSGRISLFAIAPFLAAVSIALHLLLRLAPEIGFFTYLPDLLRPRSLPFAYTYNLTAYIFFILLFTYKLGKAPLYELRENKWYLISKMGYNAALIRVFKVLSFLLLDLLSYAVGLIFAFIAITLLSLDIDTAYLLPSLAAGALQMLLLALFASLASLYSDTKSEARAFLFSAVLPGELLKLCLGYYKLLGDVSLAPSLTALFMPQNSFYGIFGAVTAFILLVLALREAKISTEYYSLKSPLGGFEAVRYQDGETVRVWDDAPRKLPAYAVGFRILMGFVIFLSLLFNAVFLLDSFRVSEKLSFSGYVPYIFGSSRMEPEIEKSDLVVIKTVGAQYVLNAGDTVFLRESQDGSEFTAMKILSLEDEVFLLDYLNYPLINMQNSLKKTVSRDNIYGVLCFKSRILGLLIIFSATPEGRVLTIVLPLALFLFTRRIFTRRKKPGEH